MSTRVLSGIICGLLGTTLVTMPAAHAAEKQHVTRVVIEDGTRDVWREFGNDEGGELDAKIAFPRADVVRVVVQHGRHAVRIRMRFVDLRKSRHDESQDFTSFIETSSGGKFLADVSGDKDHQRGRQFFQGKNGGARPCARMTHRINYVTNVVRVRIPRTCLRRPRWVRVTLSNVLDTTLLGDPVDYLENPHNRRAFPSARDETRRLYRG